MSAATTSDPILSVRGLHHAFGQTQALRGVDIDVQRVEVLAVMGPSGSGKSTLLHCLAGILVPDQGPTFCSLMGPGTHFYRHHPFTIFPGITL